MKPSLPIHEAAFETYGARFGVRFPNPANLDALHRALPRPWQAIAPVDIDLWFTLEPIRRRYRAKRAWGYNVVLDGELKRWAPTEAYLPETLEAVLHHHVAEWATPWVFIHAGVAVLNDRAVILPGSSMVGKSTLTHALVEAGATYYSDEYAVLDGDGLVWPFRRALSLRPGPFGKQRRVDYASTPEPPPVPVGLIAFLQRTQDAPLSVAAISASDAVMQAAQHAVGIRRFPERTLGVLRQVAESAQRYQGVRDEYDAAVAWILANMAAKTSS